MLAAMEQRGYTKKKKNAEKPSPAKINEVMT